MFSFVGMSQSDSPCLLGNCNNGFSHFESDAKKSKRLLFEWEIRHD